eukprot:CAMPEP_0178937310 /NCGR_PEP_ID=MMETSP0786-20121207/25676_1 /TAXON_ID=186022 /ORGANISM="Thalassionema frauenfeldii, Strain CCMP 1798" /LENGTH=2359 /DNA_ID=CAMNT_0020615847 /DNA_START=262 /DNA_END=7341 /DNA_ORIENTATION=-
MKDIDRVTKQKIISILNKPFGIHQRLGGIPTLVNLSDITEEGESRLKDVSPLSLDSNNLDLSQALEDLEHLSKDAQVELLLERDTITALTSLITGQAHHSTEGALDSLAKVGTAIPRRVCQFPFKRNDIVWVCRTCQADETCVLCHQCFKQSNHEGHDVAFYHAQAGGCCDCGDPDAWDPCGFCPYHGTTTAKESLSPHTVETVQIIVETVAQWLVETLCRETQQAHLRTSQDIGIDTSSKESQLELLQQQAGYGGSLMARRELVFCSEAASTSKSRGDQPVPQSDACNSRQLGDLTRQGKGIYLVLHADDVHTKQKISQSLRQLFGGSSYYPDSLLNKLVTSLQTHGQLIVWGTMEVLSDLNVSQRLLWADGDVEATTRFGAAMLERANRLNGLTTSLSTRLELLNEQRAVAVLEWLTALARSCDPLCQTVAESILPEKHLVPMLRADLLLLSRLTKAWHSLLLTLLAVPTFKSHLAAAYCDTYRHVTSQYARGMGVLERSGYTLSVQFLNRVTYVVDLVQHRDLLGKLGKSLYETLAVAQFSSEGKKRLDPNHFVLTHRRYSPCVSDLKCVLNVKGMARLFSSKCGTFLSDWLASLALSQWMDGQVWRTFTQGHVETEPRGWVGAFNASISLGSLFERLLCWDDTDASPAPESPLSSQVPTIVELTQYCLFHGLVRWQEQETQHYRPTSNTINLEDYSKATASLPYATIHTGEALAQAALPLPYVSPWSFHLPLHRFFAACLREVCRRPEGMTELLEKASHVQMEFPLLVLSRAAQVRAGLWKRNGSLMFDQVLNYAEPPFCRALRDADILLLQYSSLTGGTGPIVALLLHRFGIFDFCGLIAAPAAYPELYHSQVACGMYPEEITTSDGEDFNTPWTFSPTKDVSALTALLEEYLQLLVVLITELPPIPPVDKAEHTIQAKKRLRREVIHRLASGPRTHSELAEVHHVLSNWDNTFLSEEGKLLNPDDATGAALESTLNEVAEHKSVRGKLEPNQWELREDAWEEYDPAFYHISLRSHQAAAESRPNAKLEKENIYGIQPKAVAPHMPFAPHPCFERLRRDISSDATVLAITYRTLHVHCRERKNLEDLMGVRSTQAYESEALSETALSRAVHLLTLGAFAWRTATRSDDNWQSRGGSYEGSVFYKRSLNLPSPSLSDWISHALLAKPADIMNCKWYSGEENALLLLKRLAIDGGSKSVGFIAQDQSLRTGAAWLCEFASKNNNEAADVICATEKLSQAGETPVSKESELERKKREAKARAMERMNAQAARFAAMMQIDTEGSEEESEVKTVELEQSVRTESRRLRNIDSSTSSESSLNSGTSNEISNSQSCTFVPPVTSTTAIEKSIPPRLLKSRPICIICNEDTTNGVRDAEPRSGDDGNRKRSRRKTDRSNALAFVGYTQPSTVVKGGGGLPPSNDHCRTSSAVRRFVGVHVALCGHAVHSECCESYLATVSHREDRGIGRREEFKCPLCQRLSNCLVPFIDVGLDWVGDSSFEIVPCGEQMDIDEVTDEEGKTPSEPSSSMRLHNFLSNTPWWVARHDTSVTWDGQSAFVAANSAHKDGNSENASDSPSVPKLRRRSVRSLRKKDLYAAWSAMMKTPRFIRRRQPQRSPVSDGLMGAVATTSSHNLASASSLAHVPRSEDINMGETIVWRRFMDLVSDISFRADGKRLGEQNFLKYCGEFRHYHVEKHAYNAANRLEGRESAEWPTCISSSPLPDNRRQELSREKLLSKLLLTIQSFTYSCCAELFEVKRLIKKEKNTMLGVESVKSIFSKFGIADVVCDNSLVLMPAPSVKQDEGTQPFQGRIGKLRYFGLAAMAAAGAVSADLVQLVLDFPLSDDSDCAMSSSSNQEDLTYRAPVVFPVLFSHVLTHVVAAMCATCGRARARSDSLEIVWPVPFSRRGSFYGMSKESSAANNDSVMKDCVGFITIGFLARILQVLLGQLQVDTGPAGDGKRGIMSTWIRQFLKDESLPDSESTKWIRGCASLLDAALFQEVKANSSTSSDSDFDMINVFEESCKVAVDASIAFLSDIGAIYQILVPGALTVQNQKKYPILDVGGFPSLTTLIKLVSDLGLEHLDDMLHSTHVRQMISHWFKNVCKHTEKFEATGISDATSKQIIQKRIFQTEGFRVLDWPVESYKSNENKNQMNEKKMSNMSEEPQELSSPMEVDSYQSHMRVARLELRSTASSPVVSFTSRKSVNLLGGYVEDDASSMMIAQRPRIHVLPTSYTDLYAELGVICPESEQTALCLICGEVLNANGKGECTKHSFKCGAGACIFFLLQECQGLIIHNGKAVYVQSPYVDSHGETPQYRGRPLNLDLDRYDIFRELWTGHGIRQKVVQERGSARQVIITDFY